MIKEVVIYIPYMSETYVYMDLNMPYIMNRIHDLVVKDVVIHNDSLDIDYIVRRAEWNREIGRDSIKLSVGGDSRRARERETGIKTDRDTRERSP